MVSFGQIDAEWQKALSHKVFFNPPAPRRRTGAVHQADLPRLHVKKLLTLRAGKISWRR
jgi:hypothetical protein